MCKFHSKCFWHFQHSFQMWAMSCASTQCPAQVLPAYECISMRFPLGAEDNMPRYSLCNWTTNDPGNTTLPHTCQLAKPELWHIPMLKCWSCKSDIWEAPNTLFMRLWKCNKVELNRYKGWSAAHRKSWDADTKKKHLKTLLLQLQLKCSWFKIQAVYIAEEEKIFRNIPY